MPKIFIRILNLTKNLKQFVITVSIDTKYLCNITIFGKYRPVIGLWQYAEVQTDETHRQTNSGLQYGNNKLSQAALGIFSLNSSCSNIV